MERLRPMRLRTRDAGRFPWRHPGCRQLAPSVLRVEIPPRTGNLAGLRSSGVPLPAASGRGRRASSLCRKKLWPSGLATVARNFLSRSEKGGDTARASVRGGTEPATARQRLRTGKVRALRCRATRVRHYFNPTLHSPMPRSRGEAMLCGLATVNADSHDVNQFIQNGVNGFYAPRLKNSPTRSDFWLPIRRAPGASDWPAAKLRSALPHRALPRRLAAADPRHPRQRCDLNAHSHSGPGQRCARH